MNIFNHELRPLRLDSSPNFAHEFEQSFNINEKRDEQCYFQVSYFFKNWSTAVEMKTGSA